MSADWIGEKPAMIVGRDADFQESKMPTVNWAVNADGDWSDVADWSPPGLPNSSDDVTINTTDLHTVTHSTGTDTVNSLTVGNDDFVMSGGALTLNATSSFANLLSVSGGSLEFFRGGGTVANFTQSGGTVKLVGANVNVTGSMSFTGNSALSGNGAFVAKGPTSVAGGVTVTLKASSILALGGTTAIAGSVIGSGALQTIGGTITIESGARIGTAQWAAIGGAVQLAENLTYANKFVFQGSVSSTSIALGGFSLTLSGAVQFGENPTVTGPGSLITRGATTLVSHTTAGVSLGAGVTWSNFGTVTEDGTTPAEGLGGSSNVINQSGGVFDLAGDTGVTAANFVNDGLLEKTAGGGTSDIATTVNNVGTISVSIGTLLFADKVTGAGAATISGGTLQFGGSFKENVSFTGASGGLTLAHSQTYSGTISGFSLTGSTFLDLRDIGFVSAGEATFSGTATGGTLTVTDGTHTASIKLTGDYLGSTFTASSDGNGGTIVVDPVRGGATHAFVLAMAGLTAPAAAAAVHTSWAGEARAVMLARPHMVTA